MDINTCDSMCREQQRAHVHVLLVSGARACVAEHARVSVLASPSSLPVQNVSV